VSETTFDCSDAATDGSECNASKGQAMRYDSIEVRKLSPHIGAEIFGIDLSKPLGNQQFQEVHTALANHLVIFFRDQKLNVEQHLEFGRRFGRLHVNPGSPDVLPGHPEVLLIKMDETMKYVAGEDWHSDVSCDPSPPMGSILYLTEVPPDGGGDTMFANMYLAYETLSEPMRIFINNLTAVHDGEKHYRGRYGNDDRDKVYPRAEHPMVRTHPETGRKCLFVNRFFTTHIVGLRKSESDAILEMLYRHIETPELSMRFNWHKNSLAFWDNRCTQHHALWDYYPHKRYGHRVTICGDRPV
jgi:taurine dioxygenase